MATATRNAKLTERLLRSLEPEAAIYILADTEAPGLRVRVNPKGRISFFSQVYSPRKGYSVRTQIGPYGAVSLYQARQRALELAGKAASGEDPGRGSAHTVRDLAERFSAEHAAVKSASTRRNYRLLWDLYLLPELGQRKVRDVQWADIATLHRSMREKPYQANRMLAVAHKAWELAARWEWYPQHLRNPASGHERYREQRRGQALGAAQLGKIGEVLSGWLPYRPAAQAIQLMVLTGLRPKEVYRLRWSEVDLEQRVINLEESKTGPRRGYLSLPATELLRSLPQLGEHVFPGRPVSKPLESVRRCWDELRDLSGLPDDIRLYDATRHTFVSVATALEVPKEIRTQLVGHAPDSDAHSRYIHLAVEDLLVWADKVAGRLMELLGLDRSNGSPPSNPN